MPADDTSSRSDMYAYQFSKGLRIIEPTSIPLSSLFKGDNSKGQLGGATIPALDTTSSLKG